MKRQARHLTDTFAILTSGFGLAVLVFLACTPATLATVLPAAQSIAELAKELCTEDDDALACLKKCETEQVRREGGD